jgi:hypothetical protein
MINAKEALLLQGLPIRRMGLSYLIEPYLLELAGNALSSTIVGAPLIAALTTFSRVLGRDTGKKISQPPSDDLRVQRFDKAYELIKMSPADLTAVIEPITAEGAVKLAQETCARRHCEGSDALLIKKFLRCKVCDHTTCAEHGGNNRHTYQKDDTSRKWPATFEKRIKDALPKAIKFTNTSSGGIFGKSISKIAEGTWNILVEDFKKAVINDFFLSDITCCDIWDILYESAIGKLQLEISGRHVWWLLYRKVPSETGLHDSKRFHLEKFPIACCIPHGQCEITNGQWELWLPQETEMRSILQFHAPPRFPRPFGVSIVLVL